MLRILIFILLPFYAIAEESSDKNLKTSPPASLETKTNNQQNLTKLNTNPRELIQKAKEIKAQKKTETQEKSKEQNSSKSLPKISDSLNDISDQIKNDNKKYLTKNKPKFLLSKTSIMSDKREFDQIYKALSAYKTGIPLVKKVDKKKEERKKKNDKKDKNSYLRLSAMIFFSKNNWTIWLNNKKINFTNNKRNNEIYIKKISNRKVDIIWTMNLTKWKFLAKKYDKKYLPKINQDNEVVLKFSLKPKQVYLIAKNKVVENMKNEEIQN